MFDYSAPIINDDDKKIDLKKEEDKQENDNRRIINLFNDNKQLIDGDVADEDKNDKKTTVVRENINGIKAFDEIESCRRDSYFKLKINEIYKYMYKHSTCWLLTDKNIRQSNDWHSRVVN